MGPIDCDLFSLVDTLLDEEASQEDSAGGSHQEEAHLFDARAAQCGVRQPVEQFQTADDPTTCGVQLEAMDIVGRSGRRPSMDAQTLCFSFSGVETDHATSISSAQARASISRQAVNPQQTPAPLDPFAAASADRPQPWLCLDKAPSNIRLQRCDTPTTPGPQSGRISGGELMNAFASLPPLHVPTFGTPPASKALAGIQAAGCHAVGCGHGSLQGGPPPATVCGRQNSCASAAVGDGAKRKQEAEDAAPPQKRLDCASERQQEAGVAVAAAAPAAQQLGGGGPLQESGEAAVAAPAVPVRRHIGRPLSFQGDPKQTAGLSQDERRRLRRRQSNRESAQRVRQRRNEAIVEAERELVVMRRQQEELQQRLAAAEAAAAHMHAQLQAAAAQYQQETQVCEALRASLAAARHSPWVQDGLQIPMPLQQQPLPLATAAEPDGFWPTADASQLPAYVAPADWELLHDTGD